MKNKIKTCLFALIIIGVITLGLTYNKKNNITKTKKKNQSSIAIMIKEDGASNYTKSSSKDIPTGSYTLNYEKSYCKNNGVIGDYDSSVGKVSFSFIGTDSCYLYFDYKDDSIDIVTLMTVNNIDIFEENGIRYEGANPDNYICLDNKTNGSCSDDEFLFQIIGLFDVDYSTDGTNSAGIKKFLKVISTYHYGTEDGQTWSGGSSSEWWENNYEQSEILGRAAEIRTHLPYKMSHKEYGYRENINNIFKNYDFTAIVPKYYLGGPADILNESATVEEIYEIERNSEMVYKEDGSDELDNPSFIYHDAGFMYPSDYGYASPNCRDISISKFENDNSCLSENWLYNSAPFINGGEWLITPSSGNDFECLYITSTGNVAAESCRNNYAIRPVLYFDANLFKIAGGTGTQTDPYHIK